MYLREVARGEGLAVADEELRAYVGEAQETSGKRSTCCRAAKRPPPGGKTTTSGATRTGTAPSARPSTGSSKAASKEEAAASLRKLSLPPVEKIREIHRSVARSDLAPEAKARALEVVSKVDLLMSKMVEERRMEAPSLRRQGSWSKTCTP